MFGYLSFVLRVCQLRELMQPIVFPALLGIYSEFVVSGYHTVEDSHFHMYHMWYSGEDGA